MPKPRYKTTNWKQYNQSLINRGSLTFWIDEEAISGWAQSKQNKRGRPRRFSDLASYYDSTHGETSFSMPLRALQGFIDSIFRLTHVPLSCPHYTCISRRAKQVEVSFKTKTRGAIQHLAIDATGKVYGEGEWKVKKHGTDGKRRVWRKLHIAVDTNTHEIIAAELSLSTVTDGEVLPNLLKQTRRSILEVSGDGAYDTRACHTAIKIKGAIALVPPREGRSLLGAWSSSKSRRGLPEVIRLK